MAAKKKANSRTGKNAAGGTGRLKPTTTNRAKNTLLNNPRVTRQLTLSDRRVIRKSGFKSQAGRAVVRAAARRAGAAVGTSGH